jgi:hypothetical protein
VASRHLAIYLRDHLAGSTAGLELAKRAAGSNRESDYGQVLSWLAGEIDQDRDTLTELMDVLGVRRDRLKEGLAWIGEKVGRLKLNGQVTGYSPLSRLEEIEGLLLGVAGKRSLWRALASLSLPESVRVRFDFEQLVARAEEQRERLEEQRMRAVREALAPGRTG